MYYCTGLVRAAGGWGSQEIWTSGTWRCQDCQLYASTAFTPRRDPLLLISVSGRILIWAEVRPGGLSQKKFKGHINCVACTIRYTSKILLFLLPILSDIPPQYYCFCCLSYQIFPLSTTVSVASFIRYTHTIVLTLLTVQSYITHPPSPQYYCFCCLCC